MNRLVLVGGGHSHVEVLRQFGLRPAAGAEITLVSPARYTSYSGMLPGYIAGHYRYHECHIDLEYLARFAGARLIQSRACNIDPLRRQLVLTDGAALDYDIACIDIGSSSAHPTIPGGDDMMAVKPVEAFLPAWDAVMERVRRSEIKTILVVGAGAGGVELLLAMQYQVNRLAGPRAVGHSLGQSCPSRIRVDTVVGTNARESRVLAAAACCSAGHDTTDRAHLHP